jgi:hypothetical protein
MATSPNFATFAEASRKHAADQVAAKNAAAAQKAAQKAAERKAYADKVNAGFAKLGEQHAARKAAEKIRNDGIAVLAKQLGQQASGYGFNWRTTNKAETNQTKLAEILYSQGVTNLGQVTYSKDGRYLMNKDTGQNLKWYKQDKNAKKGNPLKNEGQIGWTAKGDGRTNFYVRKDAAGNPVFTPQWKSNAPGGVGGFLLKAAPAIVGFATGNPALAALTSAGIGVAGGQDIGDIIKGAAINYVAGNAGNLAANAATKALPMIGNAGLTNAVADAIGGAASGGVRSGLSGEGLSGVLPGAITGGVTSGVQSLAQDANQSIQNAGVPSAIANPVTNIAAGALAPYIATGGNTDAAIAGGTNAAINTASQLAGSAVNSALPPGVVNNFVSGTTSGIVSGGLNQLINPPPSPPESMLPAYIASTVPRQPGGLAQVAPGPNAAAPITNTTNTAATNQMVNPATVAAPNLTSQQMAQIDPRLLQLGREAVTNSVYLPSTASGGLSQFNPYAVPGEYMPTGFVAPVKSYPSYRV